MPLLNYDHFDTSTWPGAGPVKTLFSGTAGSFHSLFPQNYEDFDLDKGWQAIAAMTDDGAKEGFEEAQAPWDGTSWDNAPIHVDDFSSFPTIIGENYGNAYVVPSVYPTSRPTVQDIHGNIAKTSTATTFYSFAAPSANSGHVLVLGVAKRSGGLSSVTQANVNWLRFANGTIVSNTGIEIWVGIPTGGTPGSTISTNTASISDLWCGIASSWNYMDNPVGVSTGTQTGVGNSVPTPLVTSPSVNLWVGFHAKNTSAVSFFQSTSNIFTLASQTSIVSGGQKIGMTYFTGAFVASGMDTWLGSTSGANWSSGLIGLRVE